MGYYGPAVNSETNGAQTTISSEVDLLLDERAALIERVALSQTFRKSQKLREFFQFVCDCAIRHGDCMEVKEQQIGVHVFHRNPDYNTSEDSIVRVSARELRRRLASYFETEGKSEPIVITIPKGGYLPLFVPAGSLAHKEHESEPTQLSEAELTCASDVTAGPGSVKHRHPFIWAVAGLGGVFLFAGGWLIGTAMNKPSAAFSHGITTQQSNSFYDALLGPMGRDGNDTFLVLSNTRLLYFGPYRPLNANSSGNTLITLPPELRTELADATGLGKDPSEPFNLMLVGNGYTEIGEAASAFHIGRMMLAMGRSIRLTQGRFLNWDTAMRENLIVVGKPDINDWTHSNLASSNFIMAPHGVRNSAPLPGEKAFYQVSVDAMNNTTEDYGVIGMSTTASGSRVLTLAGRTPAGTYGTGDFFTNPDKMKIVYEKLSSMKSGKTFPQNWESLIRISVREDIPVDTTLLAVRVTDAPR